VLILRVVLVLVAAAVGACLLAYLFSQDRRYLAIAWRITKFTLIFVFVLLSLMFLERVLAPVAGVV
jgi:hypothetical protein